MSLEQLFRFFLGLGRVWLGLNVHVYVKVSFGVRHQIKELKRGASNNAKTRVNLSAARVSMQILHKTRSATGVSPFA